MVDPESLVGQIYRARYFPNGNFLSAKLGSNPSFVWRSLLEAQDLIRSGIRWRVRSGRRINVLNEPWLLYENDPYVHSSHPALVDCKVSNLMVGGGGEWDEDIIRDLFDEREAEAILAIPLPSVIEDDNFFWRGENSGVYSVKSAYQLINGAVNVDAVGENTMFWRKLWKIRVPPKVKNFLWRCAANCLPTLHHLRCKRVNVDQRCPQCLTGCETTMHGLVECPVAAECWLTVGIVSHHHTGLSFAGWFNQMLRRLDDDGVCRLAMLCWAIWRARNDKVWKNRKTSVNEVVGSAKRELDHWRSAKEKGEIPSLTNLISGDGVMHWSKPERNKIKVNVDAATFVESSTTGIGWVARDESGNIIEAGAKMLGGPVSPGVAEAVGVQEVLSWLKKKRWKNVVVESDCLVVVQSVRSEVAMLSYFGSIIDHCKRLLYELDSVYVSFVRRSANRVAHLIARASPLLSDRILVAGNLPANILAAVQDDCSS